MRFRLANVPLLLHRMLLSLPVLRFVRPHLFRILLPFQEKWRIGRSFLRSLHFLRFVLLHRLRHRLP